MNFVKSRNGSDAGGQQMRLLRGDSLAASVVFLVGVTVVQRLVGLMRNVLFCGLLRDDQLGRWSLAYSFLLLAAPLVVLGLPGSFGRYVEHYRQRGQLRAFLRRTTVASALLAVTAVVLMVFMPHGIAKILFGDAGQWPLVRILAVVLVAVIAFNFLVELLTALRLVRIVSLMQFSNSLIFALLGCGLLYWTRLREEAAMLAYGVGSLLVALAGMIVVCRVWKSLPATEPRLPHQDLWAKLLPFAGWIWVGNLVGNLFDAADQFMLKHLSGLPAAEADSLVGQYYSSRVIPVLMVAVAAMLSSCLLPHLIRDWDSGRRGLVARRINMAVKLVALTFTAGGAVVLVASPLLFTWVFRGKYDAGLSVLPGTLTYCVWFSIGFLAQHHLLCVEKARLGSLALLFGLLVNGALNYLLAPRLGLPGVVLATTVANGVALTLIFWLSRRSGMRWDRGAWLASALPLTLCLGGWPAIGIVLIVSSAGLREGWLLSEDEKGQLGETISVFLTKLRRLIASGEPAST